MRRPFALYWIAFALFFLAGDLENGIGVTGIFAAVYAVALAAFALLRPRAPEDLGWPGLLGVGVVLLAVSLIVDFTFPYGLLGVAALVLQAVSTAMLVRADRSARSQPVDAARGGSAP